MLDFPVTFVYRIHVAVLGRNVNSLLIEVLLLQGSKRITKECMLRAIHKSPLKFIICLHCFIPPIWVPLNDHCSLFLSHNRTPPWGNLFCEIACGGLLLKLACLIPKRPKQTDVIWLVRTTPTLLIICSSFRIGKMIIQTAHDCSSVLSLLILGCSPSK